MFQLVEAAFFLVVGILVLPPLAVAAHVVISVVCGVAAAIYSMITGE